ncbi:hypothetical protein CRYUN_Cryun12cG0024800 [Craigia yunnanensis]
MDMDKTAIALEAISKEIVGLENISVEEVFEKLKCREEGLSSDEVKQRLELCGYNKLEEKNFLGFMWNPLSWVMEAAVLMAISLAHGGGKDIDYHGFIGILALLIFNSTISFIEENNAGNAAAALMARLAPKAKVLRDGKWSEEDASVLVPGDIISIKLGDIIPADARLLQGDPLKIDQSALTGESLPVTKHPGNGVYSGSTCKQGEIEAVVIATGVHTFFGKAAHLVETTTHVGHFQQGLSDWYSNLLVILIGGIPIAMPTVLSVTMAIGSHRLSQQGAITKRMTAIEEMAGMDALCSDKTGTLTLNKLTVDKNLIEVFVKNVDNDTVVLMAARASRLENQDAIDAAIVVMLGDPKEARAGITEVHFLPFNPTDKRTALTYFDEAGKMHSQQRCTRAGINHILNLAWNKSDIEKKVHSIIDKFTERGLRSLAVARQEVPAGTKDSSGGPWEFVGLLPLFDPPRHDSAETIRRAQDLGVSVKIITGDQLAIAKETGRRLGMGTNMYPSSSLLGDSKNEAIGALPIDELIEKADGFAGVFPEHKFEIVKRLQAKKHIVGMTGDGVKKADIGIAVADSTDAARSASDIVLTEPGIIPSVLTTIVPSNLKLVFILQLGFMLLTVIWRFNFPPFMVLISVILNDGTIMTISKDRVKPSAVPDCWKLKEIFATGIVIGSYLALMTIIFFWAAYETDFFPEKFGVRTFYKKNFNLTDTDVKGNLNAQLASAVYLQVSTISQALKFVTRSQGWSFTERPGLLLVIDFIIAQLVATAISAHATWDIAGIKAIGWGWSGVIWLYNIITYALLDPIKFAVRYALSGRAWELVFNKRTAFNTQRDFGKEAREVAWAAEQQTLHALQSSESKIFPEKHTFRDVGVMAEETRRRAEIARLRELHTLKGRVESFAKLRGLDIDVNPHYTV